MRHTSSGKLEMRTHSDLLHADRRIEVILKGQSI